jgi:hypothetical protein
MGSAVKRFFVCNYFSLFDGLQSLLTLEKVAKKIQRRETLTLFVGNKFQPSKEVYPMIESHGTSMTSAHYSRMGYEECDKIHKASLEILERLGIDVHDEKAH